MGRVAAVTPVFEARVIGLEARHDDQPPTGFKHVVQCPEDFRRVVEVLDHLGTGDELVATPQHGRVVEIHRVIDGDLMTRLAQHRSQQRRGAAAEVEATARGRQQRQQGFRGLLQEGTIARVPRLVAVQVVGGALQIPRGALRRIQEGDLAGVAAPVVANTRPHEKAD